MARTARKFILLAILGVALVAAKPGGADSPVRLFDANIGYTSGIFVPLPRYDATSVRPFTTLSWDLSSRNVRRVTTDGVSLVIARQTAQTQPDPNPLASDNRRNFRGAANWGHGPVHKLRSWRPASGRPRSRSLSKALAKTSSSQLRSRASATEGPSGEPVQLS